LTVALFLCETAKAIHHEGHEELEGVKTTAKTDCYHEGHEELEGKNEIETNFRIPTTPPL
jgi:hypothetical protein